MNPDTNNTAMIVQTRYKRMRRDTKKHGESIVGSPPAPCGNAHTHNQQQRNIR